MTPARTRLIGVLALVALTLTLGAVSLFVGYVDMSPARLVGGTLAGELIPQRILLDIRVPRTVLCLAVGAALGITGAAMQGLLRNPLAEPGLLGCGKGLRALTLGEETAHSLGIHLGRLRVRVLVGSALAVGAAVSVSGSIGFIGLVAPHLMRPLAGGDPSRLLPLAALAGAALLTAADLAVRLLHASGPELKLGVLTALVGAPFFLVLILRTRRLET